jgi:hypothetical protein
MTKIGAGVRQPWLGGSFPAARKQWSEETEIARRKERNGGDMRNVRVDGQIPFLTAAVMRGHAMVHWPTPKIMDQWLVLTQR